MIRLVVREDLMAIIGLVADGLNEKEIAQKLCKNAWSVKYALSKLYDVLEVEGDSAGRKRANMLSLLSGGGISVMVVGRNSKCLCERMM